MTRFSANLGFLWNDLPLPEAIRAAARAGFDAVECHWPYDVPAAETRAALEETGLRMLGLNTRRGDLAAGEAGLSAVPGREDAARAAIDEAMDYAEAIGAGAVHVMAGRAEGPAARDAFAAALRHAARRGAQAGVGVLIEPLNPRDAPGYFLNRTDQAAAILRGLDAPNVRLMFDCYHVQVTEGDVTERLAALMPLIGHVQIAAAPTRAEPDDGELDYRYVLRRLAALGWTEPVGAEYRPAGGSVEAGLGWMDRLRG